MELREEWGGATEVKEAIGRHGADMLNRLHEELPLAPSTTRPGMASAVSRAPSAKVRNLYCRHLADGFMKPAVAMEEEEGPQSYERPQLHPGHKGSGAGGAEGPVSPKAGCIHGVRGRTVCCGGSWKRPSKSTRGSWQLLSSRSSGGQTPRPLHFGYKIQSLIVIC